MRLQFRKIRWEFLIALVINLLLLVLLLHYGIFAQVSVANVPPEITVSIRDFSPPSTNEMKIPAESSGEATTREQAEVAGDPASLTAEALSSSSPSLATEGAVPEKDLPHQQEIERITHGLQAFDGLARIKTGFSSGTIPAGHVPGASFQGRGNPQRRRRLLDRHGGTPKTEHAVEKALDYLASVQNRNGSWGSEECFQTGDVAALSSLALLAFFSHGETFQSQKYGSTIRRGCDFLIELANSPNIEYAGRGFGHAILTYALAEGFAVTGSLSLRHALVARLKYIIEHQNSFGSFAINYDNSPQIPTSSEQAGNPLLKEIIVGEANCDLSLLGWHIQALTAAKNAGVKMDKLDSSLAMSLEALIKIHQAAKGGFSQGINMKRFPANENMNPVGVLGLYFLNAGNSSAAHRAERILERAPLPTWGRNPSFPLYRWYYQTQALFLIEKGRGRHWKKWNERLQKELLATQSKDGSWPMPAGDNSFRVKGKSDLTIYSSSLCALMLQVYYRYLPSYSIAESSSSSKSANELDLGSKGLVSRLPGEADPMAAVILGIETTNMPTVRFGKFNGLPQDTASPLIKEEFSKLASLRSTVAVRSVTDWPQTLQANQRIAIFLDDFLPKNFKGHMQLLLGVVGTDVSARSFHQSLEIVMNGRRVYNSILLRNKQLIEAILPNDIIQPYGNILQIRNNGKAVLAFDAAELAGVNKIGRRLFLLTDESSRLPANLRELFNIDKPKVFELNKMPCQMENRQLLPEISSYDAQKTYIGEYSAIGSEAMGNEFQKYYLRQTGREIIDWIAGGGSGVKINSITTGGKFYDTIFHEEYPAVAALCQTAKLFEGIPHKIPSQVYPKYGEKPGLFLSSAASCNAPGVVTVVVAKRFPTPEEVEILAIVPWNGETDVAIERGFFLPNSPFIGFAAKIETERKKTSIQKNVFRLSTSFPELTVIRLTRKGASELQKQRNFKRSHSPQEVSFNHAAVRRNLPASAKNLKKQRIRQAGGYTAVFGSNVSCAKIPATMPKNVHNELSSLEKESVCIAFKFDSTFAVRRFDSAYLPLGNVSGVPRFLSLNILPRITTSSRRSSGPPWVTFRFVLCGKAYAALLNIGSWQKVVLPLDKINPSWQNLRIVKPDVLSNSSLQSVTFEINDVSVYADSPSK